jgi:hypothetical protein
LKDASIEKQNKFDDRRSIFFLEQWKNHRESSIAATNPLPLVANQLSGVIIPHKI